MSATPQHFIIDRFETITYRRIVTLDELREYLPDLDLTDVPAAEVGDVIEEAISDSDHMSIHEWIEKYADVNDSGTTVTPMLVKCIHCGKPISNGTGGPWEAPDNGSCIARRGRYDHEPPAPTDD